MKNVGLLLPWRVRAAVACAGAGVLIATAALIAVQPAHAAQGYSLNSEYTSGDMVAKDKDSMTKNYPVRVEVGAKSVYFGDFISMRKGKTCCGMLSYWKGATYSSSKKSVASINKKTGLVKIKKTGQFVLKASYKGKKVKVRFKAVKKGAFKKYRKKAGTKELAANKKLAKKCIAKYKKYVGKKVTKKNREELLKLYKTMQLRTKLGNGIHANDDWYRTGSLTLRREEPLWGTYRHWKTYTMVLYAPECAHAEALGQTVADYASKMNPYDGDAQFKIESVSGSGKTVTIKLASKVTESQFFGAKYAGSVVPKVGTKTAKREVIARSVNGSINGVLKVKAGSDVLTVTLDKALEKGTGYHLDSYCYAPDEGDTFFGIPDDICCDEDEYTPPATSFVAQ